MKSFAENYSTIANYQIKIDLKSNLTRLMRRFEEANEIFAKRFATNLNKHLRKHFDYYIDEKITELIKCFNYYQINEKITKSKIANINY